MTPSSEVEPRSKILDSENSISHPLVMTIIGAGTAIALFTGEATMKRVNWLLILTTLAILSAAQRISAQNIRGAYQTDDHVSNSASGLTQVEGRWYTNGERHKPATIISSRLRGTEARNELGQFTRIEFDGNGSIRALDWDDGVRGDIRRGRIEWANGTTWTRKPDQ
jgi:hypothetical protein